MFPVVRFSVLVFCLFSRITSVCSPSTSRTSCSRITPTPWCRVENLWPSRTWPGSSSNSSTPLTTIPATRGTSRKIPLSRLRMFNPVNPSLDSRFFTYGDLPLENHLKQIHEEALSKFQRIDPKTEVPPQPLWSSPVSPQCSLRQVLAPPPFTLSLNLFQREDHVTCSPDALAPDPTKQNSVCVSYLLGE